MGKRMEFSAYIWIYVCLTIFLLVCRTNATCTWPSVFDGTTWLDSQQGEIVFTSSTLSGFSIPIYGTTLSNYECVEETFDTDKIILIRSTSSANSIGGIWYTYICLKFTELTAGVSYTYYRLNPQQQDAGEYRTKPVLDGDTGTIASVCDEATGASGAEFVTIIKQGSEASAYITCPSVILGRFDFDYTDSAGTESCNDASNTEHMNVCTDKTQLAFDDPCSGQSIVYASGSVHCVATSTVGSDTYIQLYNPQATAHEVSSTIYRFSCMAISSNSLSATIVYNNCTNHQTSLYVPRSHDGTVIGASISFLPYGKILLYK
ncbi:uncharacterized protein LOC128557331 [Mercenaria mercenaria]|uniref:uncharacterized protein LOC128557331 n=1 Tax=Mercenaria mercenaria TaxID=6596 RepID=UPI00234E9A72|nr:uncharacterized protein LOC128557331 [Mercenaria mercenaria]